MKGRRVAPGAPTGAEAAAEMMREGFAMVQAAQRQASGHLPAAIKLIHEALSHSPTLAGFTPEKWLEFAETARQVADAGAKFHRNMRQSAVYAVQWTWRLLESFAAEDDGGPSFSEVDAIRWALGAERDAGDTLAGELLEEMERQRDPSAPMFVGDPDWTRNFKAGLPLGRFEDRLREHVTAMRDAVGMGDGAELPDTEEPHHK